MSTRLHRMGLRFRVLEGMDRVILHLLAAAGCSQDLVESRGADPAPDQMDPRPWLLLKRSDEPAFYGPEGSADKSHYGVGRRAIANLAELTDDLRHGGLPVQTYEPGRDTLVQQIRTFHRADGVIAIRGAEFANVAWMRRGSAAIMLATPKKRPNHYASGLAGARGVRFKLISVASNYPEVSAATVRRNLQSMGFWEPRL